MYHQVLFLFTIALCLPAQQFQMPLKRLGFVKMLATFGIIDAMDLLKPNLTRIVCLCRFIFDIDLFLYFNPGDHADLHALIFQHHT